MNISQIQLLLFDLDNTLINRDEAFAAYLRDLLQRHSASLKAEETKIIFKKILRWDNRGRTDREELCNLVIQECPFLKMTPADLWKDHQRLPEFVRPVPAVNQMLKKLSSQFAMAIVSNGSGTMQRAKMKNADLDSFFDTSLISGEVGIAKPSSGIFQTALDHFRIEPEKALMIGDDPLKDIAGAATLNIRTVLIAQPGEFSQNYLSDHRINPDAIIEKILDLKEVIPC